MFAIKDVHTASNKLEGVRLILAILLLLAISVSLFYLKLYSTNESKYARTSSLASKAVSFTPEERVQIFNQWKKDVFAFTSIIEANKVSAFTIRKPSHPTLNGLLTGVYVTKDENPTEREVYLYFGDPSNPIVILQRKANAPVDYEVLYKEMLEWKEKGYAKNDADPKLVKINGSVGIAVQPGFNFVDGKSIPRPGWVDFTRDGIQFTVLGKQGNEATSLKELIEIAESL
jgi:hypothetical protein